MLHDSGPLLVLAGPGSGKTRALTCRIAALVQDRGVSPAEILAVTFTNRAAREMKERLADLLGPAHQDLTVGTFHSVSSRLLRRVGAWSGQEHGFSILDDGDQLSLLKRLLREIAPHGGPEAGRIQHWLSLVRESGLPVDPDSAPLPEPLTREMGLTLLTRYEEALEQARALDFSGLLLMLVHQVEQGHPRTLGAVRSFSHLLVDEFQDTNRVQMQWILCFSPDGSGLWLVGDEDQSIYGWRGARLDNILGFPERFPGSRVVKLERSYRSGGGILEAAGGLIAHNRGRYVKRLVPMRKRGLPVEVHWHASSRMEAEQVVERVAGALATGLPGTEVAIFYRTQQQSRQVERALARRNIPYKVVAGRSFYERREVRDVLAYLRLLANPRDVEAFRRACSSPPRGIGKRTRQAVLARGSEEGLSVLDACRALLRDGRLSGRPASGVRGFVEMMDDLLADEHGALEMLWAVLRRSAYLEYLQARYRPNEAAERTANVQELLVAAREAQLAGAGSLRDFLDGVSLTVSSDGVVADEKVSLMTLHAAKGLEFDMVFVIGLAEGLIPLLRRGEEGDLEEERRLLYVGMTRARERLVMSGARLQLSFGQTMNMEPSRFVGELPARSLAQVMENPDPRPSPRRRGPRGRGRPAGTEQAWGELEQPMGDIDEEMHQTSW